MYKYYGILKRYNLENINRDNFHQLVNSNIFNVRSISDIYKNDNYFGMELDHNNWGFSNFYLFNKKEYHLDNIVIKEMFEKCKNRIESKEELDEKIQNIELNLNTLISVMSKIRYLKLLILELNQNITDKKYFLLYVNNFETDGYTSWYEFFYSEQIENQNFEYIFKYLKGEKDYVPSFIHQRWKEYCFVNSINEYCKQKIFEFEKYSGIKESDVIIEKMPFALEIKENLTSEKQNGIPERNDIFNDDGEIIFRYLVSKYKQKQDRAFFSYLYFYLKNKGKIFPLGDDSVEYRNFIVSNFPIETFSKLQKTETDKINSKRNRVFTLFDNYLNDFNN